MDATFNLVTLFVLFVSKLWLSFTYLQLLAVLIVIQAARYLVTTGKGNYKLPAGPLNFPVVGSLPWMVFLGPDKFLLTMARKYGAMMTTRFSKLTNVIINDYEVMKEFSLHPEFQGRPDSGVLHDNFGGLGVIDAEGPSWKHQRRFILQSLRDSGMGTMRMEEKIKNEMENVINEMKRTQGQVISIDMLMEKATSNVIFGLAFNKSFAYDDPYFIKLLSSLDELVVTLTPKLDLISQYSWLKPLIKKEMATIMSIFNTIFNVSVDFIKEHKKNFDENNPRDLIDLYLMEINKTQDGNGKSEYHNAFSEEQLVRVIADLFLAGTETSSTTIRWSILYMIRNPDVQRKVQQELDDVVGRERAPNYSDRVHLPYTVAALQEVERMAAIVPMALPRCNEKPATFKQYNFPARTWFSFNVHAIHRNPKFWQEPDKFMPTRFISAEGKVFRPPYLVPFGSGKRSCAGESLAKIEIFLMFAMLMQAFEFEAEPGKIPSEETRLAGVRSPFPYKICVRNRNI